ncbi:unnamed protein product [Linum trigynum]|uniref:Uncharacterized protein n=1 Tax=Linum trigynum TaxID=586398 RepID=A0AAV2DT19_9ROSI
MFKPLPNDSPNSSIGGCLEAKPALVEGGGAFGFLGGAGRGGAKVLFWRGGGGGDGCLGIVGLLVVVKATSRARSVVGEEG